MTPVPPLGVPSVISLAFWGGLWGIALWLMIRGVSGPRHWLLAVVLGAILPTLVALLIAASARPTLNKLAHWNLHHKEWVRMALGSGVVVMGILILATV